MLNCQRVTSHEYLKHRVFDPAKLSDDPAETINTCVGKSRDFDTRKHAKRIIEFFLSDSHWEFHVVFQ